MAVYTIKIQNEKSQRFRGFTRMYAALKHAHKRNPFARIIVVDDYDTVIFDTWKDKID